MKYLDQPKLLHFEKAGIIISIALFVESNSALSQYFPQIFGCKRIQARSHGVAYGGKCHLWAAGCQHFATLGKCFANFYFYFIFVAKERSPEILVELNLSLCDLIENSIISCTNIIYLIVITQNINKLRDFVTLKQASLRA